MSEINPIAVDPYRAVLLDFDDTLVQTRAIKWAQHRHVAKEYLGIEEITDADFLKHWGKPFPELVRELMQTDDPEAVYEHYVTTDEHYRKVAYPDALEAIKSLKAAGKILGIVSAHVRQYILGDLTFAGFNVDDFAIIQGSEDTPFHKPDGRVFEPALAELKSRFSITPEQTLYIGDGFYDYEAAKSAGLNFIGVATGLHSLEEFQANSITAVAHLGQLTIKGVRLDQA